MHPKLHNARLQWWGCYPRPNVLWSAAETHNCFSGRTQSSKNVVYLDCAHGVYALSLSNGSFVRNILSGGQSGTQLTALINGGTEYLAVANSNHGTLMIFDEQFPVILLPYGPFPPAAAPSFVPTPAGWIVPTPAPPTVPAENWAYNFTSFGYGFLPSIALACLSTACTVFYSATFQRLSPSDYLYFPVNGQSAVSRFNLITGDMIYSISDPLCTMMYPPMPATRGTIVCAGTIGENAIGVSGYDVLNGTKLYSTVAQVYVGAYPNVGFYFVPSMGAGAHDLIVARLFVYYSGAYYNEVLAWDASNGRYLWIWQTPSGYNVNGARLLAQPNTLAIQGNNAIHVVKWVDGVFASPTVLFTNESTSFVPLVSLNAVPSIFLLSIGSQMSGMFSVADGMLNPRCQFIAPTYVGSYDPSPVLLQNETVVVLFAGLEAIAYSTVTCEYLWTVSFPIVPGTSQQYYAVDEPPVVFPGDRYLTVLVLMRRYGWVVIDALKGQLTQPVLTVPGTSGPGQLECGGADFGYACYTRRIAQAYSFDPSRGILSIASPSLPYGASSMLGIQVNPLTNQIEEAVIGLVSGSPTVGRWNISAPPTMGVYLCDEYAYFPKDRGTPLRFVPSPSNPYVALQPGSETVVRRFDFNDAVQAFTSSGPSQYPAAIVGQTAAQISTDLFEYFAWHGSRTLSLVVTAEYLVFAVLDETTGWDPMPGSRIIVVQLSTLQSTLVDVSGMCPSMLGVYGYNRPMLLTVSSTSNSTFYATNGGRCMYKVTMATNSSTGQLTYSVAVGFSDFLMSYAPVDSGFYGGVVVALGSNGIVSMFDRDLMLPVSALGLAFGTFSYDGPSWTNPLSTAVEMSVQWHEHAKIFVAVNMFTVELFDATGSSIASMGVFSFIARTFMYQDLVVLSCHDGSLIGLDGGTGNPRWTIPKDVYQVADSALTSNGLLLMRRVDNFVEAVNVLDGSVVWKSPASVRAAICHSTAGILRNTPQGELVVLVCSFPNLVVLDAATGEVVQLLGGDGISETAPRILQTPTGFLALGIRTVAVVDLWVNVVVPPTTLPTLSPSTETPTSMAPSAAPIAPSSAAPSQTSPSSSLAPSTAPGTTTNSPDSNRNQTTSSPFTDHPTVNHASTTNAGAIAGGVIGAIVAIGLLGGGFVLYKRRTQSGRGEGSHLLQGSSTRSLELGNLQEDGSSLQSN